ncbi:MAG: hypothetical protein JO007_08890 [Alphaproteobacteria bacterium]|nr:hypothetical protein [Alphaproteobacteria bacterium]
MPTYKDPNANREYMRRYMQAMRMWTKVEKAARLHKARTAFLARERQLRWAREMQTTMEGRP